MCLQDSANDVEQSAHSKCRNDKCLLPTQSFDTEEDEDRSRGDLDDT